MAFPRSISGDRRPPSREANPAHTEIWGYVGARADSDAADTAAHPSPDTASYRQSDRASDGKTGLLGHNYSETDTNSRAKYRANAPSRALQFGGDTHTALGG